MVANDAASRQENYAPASINESVDQARDVGQIVKDSGVAKPQRYPQGYRSLLWTFKGDPLAFFPRTGAFDRGLGGLALPNIGLCFMAMRGSESCPGLCEIGLDRQLRMYDVSDDEQSSPRDLRQPGFNLVTGD